MRQKSWSRKAALDGARWRGSFDNALALLAGKLRPHVANNLEVGRDVLQDLGHILAEVAQLAAAIRAEILFWMVRYDFAGKMRGQRLALACPVFCTSLIVRACFGAGSN